MNAIRFALYVVLTVSVPATIGAQVDPQRDSLARELLKVMNYVPHLRAQTVESVVRTYESMPGESGKAMASAMSAFYMRYYTDSAMIPPLASAYAKHFSATELSALIAFNRTPLAKKLMDVGPDIGRVQASVMLAISQDHAAEMRAIMQQVMMGQKAKKP